MRKSLRIGSRITLGLGAVGAALVMATPASAADFFIGEDKVAQATGSFTVMEQRADGGTVQLRAGDYGGGTYGWARLTNTHAAGARGMLEVDTNGDRVADERTSTYAGADGTGWTGGYLTSSSSDRAFRACIVFEATARTCDDHWQTVATGWW